MGPPPASPPLRPSPGGAPAAPEPPQQDRARALLQVVGKRPELDAGVPAVQGFADQPVGERGILGQQRAVEVGPVHVGPDTALPPVLTVVAEAVEDAAEGPGLRPQERAAPVVLE